MGDDVKEKVMNAVSGGCYCIKDYHSKAFVSHLACLIQNDRCVDGCTEIFTKWYVINRHFKPH